MNNLSHLKETFLELAARYCPDQNHIAECWNEIRQHYEGNDRYYHNFNHLTEMLQHYEDIRKNIENPDAFLFALFYHDIIYNPLQNNNEKRSAALFKKRFAACFPDYKYVSKMIKETKSHKISDDSDIRYFLDTDLAILGYEPDLYVKYSEQIRQEFQFYPDFVYQKGRKKVLKKFLKKPYIYQTPYFREKYENSARTNLRNEYVTL